MLNSQQNYDMTTIWQPITKQQIRLLNKAITAIITTVIIAVARAHIAVHQDTRANIITKTILKSLKNKRWVL